MKQARHKTVLSAGNLAELFWYLLIPWLHAACTAPPPVAETTPVETLPEIHLLEHPTNAGTAIDAYDAAELFDRGNRALEAGNCEEAVSRFHRLQREFPASEYVAPSLYNCGICLDELGRFHEAAEAYRSLIKGFPELADLKDTLFRLSSSLEATSSWEEMIATLDALARQDTLLSPIDKVEIRARKGAALIELDSPALARVELEHAVRIFTRDEDISSTAPDYYYAMAQFKLAELTHAEMRKVTLPGDDDALGEILEKKCQLLLDAQYLYTRVIRIGHPHWSGAAAYQTGALYHHLWRDMLTAPPPAALSETEREIYTEVLRKRIKVLLQKSVKQWRRTLKFALRLHLDNAWVTRTQADLNEIEKLLEIEAQVGQDLPIE